MKSYLRLRVIDTHDGVTAVLGKCCEARTPAMLSAVARGEGAPAACVSVVFAEASRVALTAEVEELFGPEPEPGALCSATFVIGDQMHVFLTRLTRVLREKRPARDRLVLEIPGNTAAQDERAAARIPVPRDGELSVTLEVDGYAPCRPATLDISMPGIQIEFSHDDDPGLAIGSVYPIVIQLGETRVKCMVDVRRKHGGRYGLMFIEEDGALENFETERGLREIVDELRKENAALILGAMPL